MNTYIYEGVYLCDECGPNVRDDLKHQGQADDWQTTSDEYPMLCTAEPGDSAINCDRCGFLICAALTEMEEV